MDDKEKRLEFDLMEKIVKKRNEEKLLRIKEYWNNLPRFEKPYDIPNIPIVDEKEYKEFYIPKLIAAGAIPKKNMENGQLYLGKHRNCIEARWNKELNKFEYWRYKFGFKFIDTCNHFEDDDGFALFVPIKKIQE
jgi:hypothetical protein